MATWTDARRIARSLPGAQVAPGGFAFSVENKGKPKGFAWIWKERAEPKKPRVPNPGVIAVRVRNERPYDLVKDRGAKKGAPGQGMKRSRNRR